MGKSARVCVCQRIYGLFFSPLFLSRCCSGWFRSIFSPKDGHWSDRLDCGCLLRRINAGTLDHYSVKAENVASGSWGCACYLQKHFSFCFSLFAGPFSPTSRYQNQGCLYSSRLPCWRTVYIRGTFFHFVKRQPRSGDFNRCFIFLEV